MHLKIGELSTIVISSPHVAEEALKKNDLAFADRPQVLLSKIVFYNYVNLSSSPYGEYWREMRKLFIMKLLSSKKVKSFYTIMEEEVSNLVAYIRSLEGFPINLTEKVSSVTSAVTCRWGHMHLHTMFFFFIFEYY